MAAPMSKKAEKRILKKQLRSQHTLFKHENIKPSTAPTQHLVVANGGLGNNVSREDLEKVFSPHGKILHILMKPSKPYAFVSFSFVQEAENALLTLNGQEIESTAKMSNPPTLKLYVSFIQSVPGFEAASSVLPPGLLLHPEFISMEYEEELLKCIDWEEHDSNIKEGSSGVLKHRRVKHYGYEFLYSINNVDVNCPLEHSIPQQCDRLIDKLFGRGIISQRPDQLTINQYQPGQGIPPHVDTHSAFEDEIVSLSLGSQVIMDFCHPDGTHFPVLLPQRSVAVMTKESRLQFTHGITPRKSDVVPRCDPGAADGGTLLTLQPRNVRTSFTFRRVRRSPCKCDFPNQCDSQQSKSSTSDHEQRAETQVELESAARLEELHVHKVYEEIAGHFSDTRHTPWPKVSAFLQNLPAGSIVADIGCGNGKYMAVNPSIVTLGSDRSLGLCGIARERGGEVCACDVLHVPLRSGVFDAAVCIAVIHHLSTEARRLTAITEITRVLGVGGQALIYVWALEQQRNRQKSTYISGKRDHLDDTSTQNEREVTQNKSQQTSQSVAVINHDNVRSGDSCMTTASDALPPQLQLHVNRTEFKSRDLLVPWHLRGKKSCVPEGVSVVGADSQNNEVDSASRSASVAEVHHRFYHVFEEKELEMLCSKVPGVSVKQSYYDQGNWCVILEKL